MSVCAGVHSEIKYIMSNGHMGTPLDRQTDRHTRLKTLPSTTSLAGGNEAAFFN